MNTYILHPKGVRHCFPVNSSSSQLFCVFSTEYDVESRTQKLYRRTTPRMAPLCLHFHVMVSSVYTLYLYQFTLRGTATDLYLHIRFTTYLHLEFRTETKNQSENRTQAALLVRVQVRTYSRARSSQRTK